MPDDETFTNKAHKAYLILSYEVKAAANAPAYAPRLFAEGTTSINSTVNDTENSGIVYNHMGNRVNSNYRGIVIVNGRKVLKNR